MLRVKNKKAVWAWAFYDWANSAFATTVIAGFFPILFKEFWSTGVDPTVTTFRLGTANSLSGVVVVVLAPILGAIADKGSAKKRLLGLFAGLGILMTASLFFVQQGHWQLAIIVYATASTGFTASIVFYDSLIISVTTDERSDIVSAFGFALGYLGGGVLFALNVFIATRPESFGFADAWMARRISFLSVAVWWAIFSIPIFLFVKEPAAGRYRGFAAVREGISQLFFTVKKLRAMRTVVFFLVAYWLYIDGVQTIARMAVDYGLSLGFPAESLVKALLFTQIIGFPAALAFGKIGEKFGAKAGIYIGIAGYCFVCFWAYFMSTVRDVYILAGLVGLMQGGIQSLSRSFYSRIIPKSMAGEFFGFYNMLGKFAAVIGPVLMGWVGVLTGSPRASMISVIVLFIAGWLLLVRAHETEGRQRAAEMDRAGTG